ncbi:MAG TPA: hypothetical protein VFW03_26875 [Gemmatimonadaceae bacterium]|nr:hypothetical protein [Gemmatimonadaceae bacterium]
MPRFAVARRAVGLVLILLAPRTASTQTLERDPAAHRRFVALNVAIGATASVARAVASGAPVRAALAKGLLGGSLMSAGMELIGTESSAARFAGLQLTAVGASVARDAEAAGSLLSDVTLPIYPFYVHVQRQAAHPVTARLSVMSAARLATVMTSGSRPRVDWRETLITGAPVLRSAQWRLPSSSCPPPCAGSFAQHNAGLVIYSASAGTDYDLQRTLAHESMHLAQQTRDAVLAAIPASDAALARLGPGGRTLSRFLVVDVVMPLRFIDEGELRMRGGPRRSSWYETEARAFAPGGELR